MIALRHTAFSFAPDGQSPPVVPQVSMMQKFARLWFLAQVLVSRAGDQKVDRSHVSPKSAETATDDQAPESGLTDCIRAPQRGALTSPVQATSALVPCC